MAVGSPFRRRCCRNRKAAGGSGRLRGQMGAFLASDRSGAASFRDWGPGRSGGPGALGDGAGAGSAGSLSVARGDRAWDVGSLVSRCRSRQVGRRTDSQQWLAVRLRRCRLTKAKTQLAHRLGATPVFCRPRWSDRRKQKRSKPRANRIGQAESKTHKRQSRIAKPGIERVVSSAKHGLLS